MEGSSVTTTSRSVLGLLLAVALLAAACASEDPQTRLENAFERTFDSSFAYELTIEADQEALQQLPGGGAQVGTMLQGLAVSGRRAGDAVELRLGFGGFNLFELRSLPDDQLFVRLALDQLGAFLGGQGGLDPDATIVPPLEQAGVPSEVIDAVRAAFDGRWVGIEGQLDPQQLQDALGGVTPSPAASADEEAVREALCEDLRGFAECYITVQEVTSQDGQDVFQVQLALREVVRAVSEAAPAAGEQVEDLESDLATLPDQVPATVTVRDGRVTQLAVDIAEAMRSGGSDTAGTIEIRLDLTEHGEVEDITVPEDAVTITGDQLAEAMVALSQVSTLPGAVPDPDPTAPASPATEPAPSPTPGG